MNVFDGRFNYDLAFISALLDSCRWIEGDFATQPRRLAIGRIAGAVRPIVLRARLGPQDCSPREDRSLDRKAVQKRAARP